LAFFVRFFQQSSFFHAIKSKIHSIINGLQHFSFCYSPLFLFLSTANISRII
jgi:hypothetical protein